MIRPTLSLLTLVVLSVLPSYAPIAQPTPPELFQPVPADLAPPPQERLRVHPAYRIIRYVKLKIDLLSPEIARQVNAGNEQRVTLHLYDQDRYVAKLSEANIRSLNRYTLRGNIENVSGSRVIVAFRNGIVAATINLGQRLLHIRQQSGDIYSLIEIDQAAFPPEASPVSDAEPDDTARAVVRGRSCESQIGVMVLYTDDARLAAGGTTNIELEIDLAIEQTNEAYERSGVNQRIVLSDAIEVDYGEINDFGTMLEQLVNPGDGVLDHIHRLRQEVFADVVSMIVETQNDPDANANCMSSCRAAFEDCIDCLGGPPCPSVITCAMRRAECLEICRELYPLAVCGIARLMEHFSAGFYRKAFSVVPRDCASGNYSLAHELGHNMGLEHDRANATSQPVRRYAFGFRHTDPSDPNKNFRTIMAYRCDDSSPCPRILNFSNPRVSYAGVPTGIDYAVDPDRAGRCGAHP